MDSFSRSFFLAKSITRRQRAVGKAGLVRRRWMPQVHLRHAGVDLHRWTGPPGPDLSEVRLGARHGTARRVEPKLAEDAAHDVELTSTLTTSPARRGRETPPRRTRPHDPPFPTVARLFVLLGTDVCVVAAAAWLAISAEAAYDPDMIWLEHIQKRATPRIFGGSLAFPRGHHGEKSLLKARIRPVPDLVKVQSVFPGVNVHLGLHELDGLSTS